MHDSGRAERVRGLCVRLSRVAKTGCDDDDGDADYDGDDGGDDGDDEDVDGTNTCYTM